MIGRVMRIVLPSHVAELSIEATTYCEISGTSLTLKIRILFMACERTTLCCIQANMRRFFNARGHEAAACEEVIEVAAADAPALYPFVNDDATATDMSTVNG